LAKKNGAPQKEKENRRPKWDIRLFHVWRGPSLFTGTKKNKNKLDRPGIRNNTGKRGGTTPCTTHEVQKEGNHVATQASPATRPERSWRDLGNHAMHNA
jgi:hypothetical protein